jgi:hypothetical protein
MKLKDLLLEAGGEKPGKLEVASTSAATALEHLKSETDTTGEDWQEFLEVFEDNYDTLKSLVKKGKTKRRDMPVIGSKQVDALQHRLKNGILDVIDHKSHNFHKDNAFPEGLTGEQADEWLIAGLNDGHPTDDKINVTSEHRKVGSLTPIQEQIYAEIPIDMVVTRGVAGAYRFISDTTRVIISKDGFLLDGHHRWAAGVLLDPKLTVECIVIDIDKEKLIKILLSYSDALGNKRNG